MIKNFLSSVGLVVGLTLATLAPVAVEAQNNNNIYLPVVGDLLNTPVTNAFCTNGLPGITQVTNPVIIDVPQGVNLVLFPNIYYTNITNATFATNTSTSNLVFQFATSPWTNSPQFGQGPTLGATNFNTQTNLAFAVPLNAVTNSAGQIIGYGVLPPTNTAGSRKLILTAIYNYSTNGLPIVSNCWFSAMIPAPR